ncbi:NAD(P)-dependent oxidoreductase [Magnetovibrio sp.]|uniref:NAD-dependent epimerase/dehydratase family protein n=1 Tax=Magnetovibrio sp. TaxID=2024836 RepID=UPI002F92D38B
MLKHNFSTPKAPERAVILGGGGFVGGATAQKLQAAGVDVLSLTRQDLDLEAPNASEKLVDLLRPQDVLIFVSAKAPVKDVSMLTANMRMLENVCIALEQKPVAQVIYVSSDAVFSDSADPLTEVSRAQPDSLHGVMHLAREVALRNTVKGPLAIIRPTLIYGANDPHNGYGPNRFRRLVADGQDIVLFGEGEERRDHVLVDDVAELINLMVLHRSEGDLNAATGRVASFREIAEMVVGNAASPVSIKGSPRSGPMPHNGYRPFDPRATKDAFPDFSYTPLEQGLKMVQDASGDD